MREVKQGTFNFEKLDVWQEAIRQYHLRRYTNVLEQERFGLTNQMRRAAVSVSSNLAEGSSRSSRLDFARFVEIATGSLFEVLSQAKIALNQELLTREIYSRISEAAEKQSRMLSGLRRSLIEQ